MKLEPDTARVNIQVFPNVGSRAIPVSPVVTGTPAAGFEVATITVDPTVVTVKGDAERLAALESIDTEPVSVTDATETVEATVELAPPDDVAPLDGSTVKVTITLRPVTSTRTFEVGFRYVGDDPDLRYTVALDRVLVTIGGSAAALDDLQGSALVADLDVGDLGPGTSDVAVTIDLPPGLNLVAADPASVPVTVTAPPPPTASPEPAIASPSASPSG